MKPIKFDEANKNLLKPQNMTDEEIADKLARVEEGRRLINANIE